MKDTSIVSAAVSKKLTTFVGLVDRLIQEQPKLLLSELYHLILDETGYVRELRAEGTDEAMDRVENLEELDNVLKEFEEEYFRDSSEAEQQKRKFELLPAFIEQSSLASDADSKDQNLTSVKLMTLHSSKGLEFPVVFLVGCEEGLFPSVKAWEEEAEEDVEEERRLCYVGMTRAREQLYMTHVVIRRFWGNTNYQEPSRFLAEIPKNLIELRDFSKVHQTRSFETAPREGYGARPTSGYGVPTAAKPNPFLGRRVRHPEYGDGTVLALEGSGADQKVVIEFRGREQRKFLLRYVATFFE